MIVKGGHFQSVLKQRRHHRIDHVLQQYQVAHHNVIPTFALRQCEPTAESESSRNWIVRDCDVQVIPRYIDFQHVLLVVARFPDDFQGLLIISGISCALKSAGAARTLSAAINLRML